MVAHLCLYWRDPSCITLVWYCSLRHIGHVFLPVNFSNACRHV